MTVNTKMGRHALRYDKRRAEYDTTWESARKARKTGGPPGNEMVATLKIEAKDRRLGDSR